MNSIGERVRVARMAKGLSQRALAAKIGVSAMAVSKYEREMDLPGSGVMLRLSKALEMKPEFFFRQIRLDLSEPKYRCAKTLKLKEKKIIEAKAKESVERFLEAQDLLAPEGRFNGFNAEISIKVQEDVENAALKMRKDWDLGEDSIENLTQILEDHGFCVQGLPWIEKFVACTFMIQSANKRPVIVFNSNSTIPGDRQRFSLAHELGHLCMAINDGVAHETAANRFAGAFLVPRRKVYFELGNKRRHLDIEELLHLKLKYGLSMRGWIHRAEDLGILPSKEAVRLKRLFKDKGWDKKEPGDQLPQEQPARLKQMVLKALSEEQITHSRAAEILGVPLTEVLHRTAFK